MKSNKKKQKQNNGLLIVVEGIDGAGKSTLCQFLKTLHIVNNKSVVVAFPQRNTPSGRLLNKHLKTKQIQTCRSHMAATHILFEYDRYIYANKIKQYINAGINVICDRWAYSGAAYSIAKGLDPDWCLSTSKYLPPVDVLIYIDVPLKVAMSRIQGCEVYENNLFLKKVKACYDTVLTKTKDCDVIIRIDGSKSLNNVRIEIINRLQSKGVKIYTDKIHYK